MDVQKTNTKPAKINTAKTKPASVKLDSKDFFPPTSSNQGSTLFRTFTCPIQPQSSEYDAKIFKDNSNSVDEVQTQKTIVNQNEFNNIIDESAVAKNPCHKKILDMLVKNKNPNVEVSIDGERFHCHMAVLRVYSNFFEQFANEQLITLPPEKVTPLGFKLLYEWMLTEEPKINHHGILDLFIAANFLGVMDLVDQCWICFDDHKQFYEDKAFMIYMEARKYNLKELQQLMKIRVTKFFLTIVASKDFLDMDVAEVCEWLQLNSIGVNSEMEIFMAIIRWLAVDWDNRKEHTLKLIKCVRFCLMPAWYLVMLKKTSDCREVLRVISDPDVYEIIEDAISVNTVREYQITDSGNYYRYMLERYKLNQPKQREWIFDEKCDYHKRLGNNDIIAVTYPSFIKYMNDIKIFGFDHWRSLEVMETFKNCRNVHPAFLL